MLWYEIFDQIIEGREKEIKSSGNVALMVRSVSRRLSSLSQNLTKFPSILQHPASTNPIVKKVEIPLLSQNSSAENSSKHIAKTKKPFYSLETISEN